MADKVAVKETMFLRCNYGPYAWNTVTHRITVNTVIKYLRDNPTLDETKPPMMFSPLCNYGTDKIKAMKFGPERTKAVQKFHTVSFDALRKHIEQHPELTAIFNKTAPPKVKTKTVTTIIERPLALTDNELSEMRLALQRQQHIRNEYVRRAYMAIERVDDPSLKATYQKELDEQLAGMATLRTLMERLDVPMDAWTNKDLALAQLALIEGKEASTDDLHVPVS